MTISFGIGALGTVTKTLVQALDDLEIRGAYDKFPDVFIWAFTIVVDS